MRSIIIRQKIPERQDLLIEHRVRLPIDSLTASIDLWSAALPLDVAWPQYGSNLIEIGSFTPKKISETEFSIPDSTPVLKGARCVTVSRPLLQSRFESETLRVPVNRLNTALTTNHHSVPRHAIDNQRLGSPPWEP